MSFILDVSSTVLCTHGAPVSHVPSQPRVLLNGAPALVLADSSVVAGCPFMLGNTPSPCLRVQWVRGATRVFASGQPVLTMASSGLCLSPAQAPQGPPTPAVVQPRVQAT